jgi:hypothetical protein
MLGVLIAHPAPVVKLIGLRRGMNVMRERSSIAETRLLAGMNGDRLPLAGGLAFAAPNCH